MRISLKQLLGIIAFAAFLSLLAALAWRSRAPDSWGFGKLGVTDGTPASAAYYLEVRGIGANPTIARLVRFTDLANAPTNALEISNRFSTELDFHTRNASRLSGKCLLIAGRTDDEEVEISIDAATAQRLFARDGNHFDNYYEFEELWTDYVITHLPFDR